MTSQTLLAGAALAGMVAFAPAATVQAARVQQNPNEQHHAQSQAVKPAAQGKMTMDCQSMMVAHRKMMDEMQAMDASLDTLVQAMNNATGTAKVNVTAAVVTELVAERKTMRERMSGMQGQMMQHMMEHMQAGGTQGAMQCPMMKEMGGSPKK